MNGEKERDPLVALMNKVLQLGIGEMHVLREPHLPPMTAHRYRDGWLVLFDHALDRKAVREPHPIIGLRIGQIDEMADFLCGEFRRAPIPEKFFYRGEDVITL